MSGFKLHLHMDDETFLASTYSQAVPRLDEMIRLGGDSAGFQTYRVVDIEYRLPALRSSEAQHIWVYLEKEDGP